MTTTPRALTVADVALLVYPARLVVATVGDPHGPWPLAPSCFCTTLPTMMHRDRRGWRCRVCASFATRVFSARRRTERPALRRDRRWLPPGVMMAAP